jgi:hypothetical protein
MIASKTDESMETLHGPHEWKKEFLKKPKWCSFCSKFVWGLTAKTQMVLTCANCKFTGHENCCLSASTACLHGDCFNDAVSVSLKTSVVR